VIKVGMTYRDKVRQFNKLVAQCQLFRVHVNAKDFASRFA
jgi:hypothetical protein